MWTGVGWGLSVQPEFGPGQALGVLPAVLLEGETYIFLSMMQQAKCQEVGQPRVHVKKPEWQIVPPFDSSYPKMTDHTPE